MIKGSETQFRPGPSFASSGEMYKKVPAVIKGKNTLMCTSCRRYRVAHLNFNEPGDECRYCKRYGKPEEI